MEIHELIKEIEEGMIHSDLQLASTTQTLLGRLDENPSLGEARRLAAQNSEAAELLLEKAEGLFALTVPPGYVHPDDLALAAYISILAGIRRQDVSRFIDQVAHANRPEFFRATPLARYFASWTPENAAHLSTT